MIARRRREPRTRHRLLCSFNGPHLMIYLFSHELSISPRALSLKILKTHKFSFSPPRHIKRALQQNRIKPYTASERRWINVRNMILCSSQTNLHTRYREFKSIRRRHFVRPLSPAISYSPVRFYKMVHAWQHASFKARPAFAIDKN